MQLNLSQKVVRKFLGKFQAISETMATRKIVKVVNATQPVTNRVPRVLVGFCNSFRKSFIEVSPKVMRLRPASTAIIATAQL